MLTAYPKQSNEFYVLDSDDLTKTTHKKAMLIYNAFFFGSKTQLIK